MRKTKKPVLSSVVVSAVLPEKMTFGELERAYDTAFTNDRIPADEAAQQLKDLILNNPLHARQYEALLVERLTIVRGLLRVTETLN